MNWCIDSLSVVELFVFEVVLESLVVAPLHLRGLIDRNSTFDIFS